MDSIIHSGAHSSCRKSCSRFCAGSRQEARHILPPGKKAGLGASTFSALLLASAVLAAPLPLSAQSAAGKSSAGKAPAPVCTEVKLAETKPSWITVLGGGIVSAPVRSAGGYIAPVEGKMLYSFNEEGQVVWQHGIPQLPSMMSTGTGGMLCCVSRGSRLSLVNPSGLQLWIKDTGFTITDEPYTGHDGRIFVRGSTTLACYGLKGVRRWKINVQDQNTSLPLVELNDGTLFIFLNKTENGKTIAHTVSPFGTIGEEIVFSGTVCSAATCTEGVLLAFADGSIGLCASGKNGAYSKWIVSNRETGLSGRSSIIPGAFSADCAAFVSGQRVILADTATGSIRTSFSSGVNAGALTFKGMTAQGLVLADSSRAECYNKDGNPLWRAIFGSSKGWNYLFPTDAGYLVFCDSNWTIESYRIRQGGASASSFQEARARPYTELYAQSGMVSSSVTGRAISPSLCAEMKKAFGQGDFGERERKWISLLNNEMAAINSAWTVKSSVAHTEENNYFRTHVDYTEQVLGIAASTGTGLYQGYVASLIRSTRDRRLLTQLIKDAGSMAYDPDGLMLSAIETVLVRTDAAGNDELFTAVCDATYEICRFMGRPTFFDHGKDMLARLLYPQYSRNVQDYAKETLRKIIKSKL